MDLYNELLRALPEFRAYYAAHQEGYDCAGAVDFQLEFGSAIFVKKPLMVKSMGSFWIYRSKGALKKDEPLNMMPKAAQYLTFEVERAKYIMCNIHGAALWPKTDTPERLRQSRVIVNFLAGKKGKKIVCGDFNLFPETESVAMFEKAGMMNLIKQCRIKDTRTAYYRHDAEVSDYCFVSPDVAVEHFAVLPDSVSDHHPLMLKFS